MQPTPPSDTALKNWAGNIQYSARNVVRAESVQQLQDVVRAASNVRVLGSRHSFNNISVSDDTLVLMEGMDRVLEIDAARRTVTVEGGIRYGQLGVELHRAGFALRNLASLPHISVAGACATATHGSGEKNGNLATSVSAIEFVTASGDLLNASRESHGDEFNGMAASLGALGIVSQLTLDIVPTFEVRQYVYENLALASAMANFDAIQQSGYSVSLFTDWTSERFTQLWLKQLSNDVRDDNRRDEMFGATLSGSHLHPIAGVGAEHCTPQLGEAGAWHERLPHFRMEFTPSNGEELQSEYFVPRQHAAMAIRALMNIGAKIAPHLFVSEVRTIALDNLWLSPCYDEACVAFHFTWKRDWGAVAPLLRVVEEALAPFVPRPHWGKLFAMSPREIETVFPRIADFRALRSRLDPNQKFSNQFVRLNLG